ncbi:hypothetical protein FOCC_FOCC001450, partial [Frankliniella occidentalis]
MVVDGDEASPLGTGGQRGSADPGKHGTARTAPAADGGQRGSEEPGKHSGNTSGRTVWPLHVHTKGVAAGGGGTVVTRDCGGAVVEVEAALEGVSDTAGPDCLDSSSALVWLVVVVVEWEEVSDTAGQDCLDSSSAPVWLAV